MNTETVKISNCSENEETCDAGKIGVFFVYRQKSAHAEEDGENKRKNKDDDF